jgi:hypothetical protein
MTTASCSSGGLPSREIDQCRRFVLEASYLVHSPTSGSAGTFLRVQSCPIRVFRKAKSGAVEHYEPLCRQSINKYLYVMYGFFRYAFGVSADLVKEGIQGAPTVKEFPDEDTSRTHAKTTTRIRVEEHSPIVKLLPEYDYGVG